MSVHIETVHRVSDLGAVITQASKGTTQHGFEAEWRAICLLTIDGELFSGCELFDEADVEAALARFEELSEPVPRLANAASRAVEPIRTYFAAREWDSVREILADRHFDRRSSANRERRHPRRSGRHGRRFAVGRGCRVHRCDVGRHCNARRASRPSS